jgi:hypothetical protein
VSEENYLTDEDLQATDQIVEGSYDRQMGEHILFLWKGGRERQEEETRSLLDAISRARMAQEGGQK